MTTKSFNSTAAGQKAMFYAAHDVVAADQHRKMAELSYDAGYKDRADNKPRRFPKSPDYMRGYTEGQS